MKVIALEDETVGLITYMRTDSTRLSDTFVNSAAQDYIGEKYGKEYIGKVKVRKENRKCSRRSRRDSSYECIKNAGKCKRNI